MRETILNKLKELTNHSFVELVLRGNSAIDSALSLVPKDKIVLIPEEGGWIHYEKAPKKLGLGFLKIKCDDAKINLTDLKQKLSENDCGVLLYQNPGGYFAEQPMEEIYVLCRKHGCLVVLDVSGAIGTKLCDGQYADILIGSFGEWKLVEAKVGGFISCKEEKIFAQIKCEPLTDEASLMKISSALKALPERIKYLLEVRKKIISELQNQKCEVVHPQDLGFVAVIKFKDESEKKQLIDYCQHKHLPYTLCPRYIRLNQPAVCIEVKQLEKALIS